MRIAWMLAALVISTAAWPAIEHHAHGTTHPCCDEPAAAGFAGLISSDPAEVHVQEQGAHCMACVGLLAALPLTTQSPPGKPAPMAPVSHTAPDPERSTPPPKRFLS